jgi:hypothetical protein
MADTIKIGKVVQNRVATGNAVAASAEHNAAAVGTMVEARLAPWIADLGPGTVEKIIAGLGSLLESSGATMIAAEKDYVEELADDVAPRNERDAADSEGRMLWASMQRAVADAFGDEGLRSYAMAAPLPTTPAELAERLAMTIDFLKKKPARGKDLLDNEVDTAKLAAKLAAVHARLAGALKKLVKEERERQTAIGRRDAAVAAWARDYQAVANALVGLYLLAGERGAAEWLRPTVRRTTGSDVAEPGEGGDAPAEPGGQTAPA